MANRYNNNKRGKAPLTWVASALIGLAALWLGVDADKLRNHPEQAVEQIGQAIAQTSTPAPSAQPPAGQWPSFLTNEAIQTVALIQRGGPYPYRQDGTTFGNREKRLPQRQRGWYREFTVDTPGLSHRGPRRIVTGGNPPSEWYYTADHYDSFRPFTPPAARSH